MKKVMVVLIILTIILSGCSERRGDNFKIKSKKGVMDLTNWDFDRDGLIKLDGEWEFYWNKLISPEEFFSGKKYEMTDYIKVPSHWDLKKYKNNKRISGEGYGTYRVNLFLKPDNKPRCIKIGSQGLSYRIWLNGKLVAENGKITTREEEKVILRKYENYFIFVNNQLKYDIVIQVSNYSRNTGGLWGSLVIGNYWDCTNIIMSKNISDSIFIGIFAIIGLYNIILYSVRKKELMYLYLGLFSWAVSGRIIVAGNILFEIFNDGLDANLKLKMIHVNLTFVVIFAILYLKEMYKDEISKKVIAIVLWVSYSFLFTVIFFKNDVYDFGLPIYELIIVGLIILSSGNVFKTIRKNKNDATIMVIGFGAFIVTSINDILYASGIIYTFFMVSFGFLCFTMSQVIMMAKRYNNAFIKMENMSNRLMVLDKLKDQFLTNTSHELRTPLNGIIGITESLIYGAEGKISDAIEKNLKLVVASGKRLSNLINDILDMSKLKQNNITLYYQNINLRLLSESVINLSKPLIGSKSIVLENKITDNIYVSADENRLNQIFYNLIGNAIKFTEKGNVWIEAKEAGEFIRIIVGDTGIGISEDKKEVIFESFFQVEGSETRKYSGTGLGLSITKTLVELHEGQIYVESKVGKGSQFVFTIKKALYNTEMEEEPIVETKIDVVKENISKLEIEKVSDVKKEKKILVIDDDLINIKVVINLTKNEEYDLVFATSGKEGLEIIERENIELVLLDVMMPFLSGFEVTEIIRKKFDKIELPIIMLTARSHIEDVSEAFEKGANDYVVKPIVKEELLNRIRNQISIKAAAKR